MKSFRSTVGLAIAMAALAGYAYYDYVQEQKKTAAQAEQEKILGVKAADIHEVRLVRPGETVVLKLVQGQWQMTEPVADAVENETIASHLDTMASERGAEMPKAKSGSYNWSEYGLNQPGLEAELTKSDGNKVKFAVSSQAAFDGSYYVRLNDRLFLGGGSWARIAEKGSAQLRDKRFWRKQGAIERLIVETQHPDLKEKMVLVKKEGKWSQEGKSHLIDATKVDGYLSALKEIRALDYVANKADVATLKKYGLDRPVTKITLGEFTASVSAEKDNAAYVKTSEADAILRLSGHDAGQLKIGSSDVRDGRVPFKMNLEQVRQLQVKAGQKVQTFKKEGSDWKLDGAKPEQKVQSENLQKVFENISNLEAKSFLPSTQKVGAIKQKVEFLNGEGKPLLAVEVGEDFTPKGGRHQNEGMTYLRVSSIPEVLAVSTADLQKLPLDQLIQVDLPAQQSEKK
ncbi:MAG: DUF4340 domain-containing protein [Bdellovibrionales bacterium]